MLRKGTCFYFSDNKAQNKIRVLPRCTPQRYHRSCKEREWATPVAAAPQPLFEKELWSPSSNPGTPLATPCHLSPTPAISGSMYTFFLLTVCFEADFLVHACSALYFFPIFPKTFLMGTHFIQAFLV